jgi:hypothetical protein
MTALDDGARQGMARELDDAIRAVVVRLSRPHASGGHVIERAAILAGLGGDPGARRVTPRRHVLPVGAPGVNRF